MIIQQITFYLQGKLAEREEMNLWERLLWDEETYQLFEMYLMLKECYSYPDL